MQNAGLLFSALPARRATRPVTSAGAANLILVRLTRRKASGGWWAARTPV